MKYVKIKDPGDVRFCQLSVIIAIQILESPISSPPIFYSPWLGTNYCAKEIAWRFRIGESPKLMIRRWIKLDQKPDTSTSRQYTQKCDLTLKWLCEVFIFSFVLKGVGCEVFGCKQRMPTNEKCSIQCFVVPRFPRFIPSALDVHKENSRFRNFHGTFRESIEKNGKQTTQNNYIYNIIIYIQASSI